MIQRDLLSGKLYFNVNFSLKTLKKSIDNFYMLYKVKDKIPFSDVGDMSISLQKIEYSAYEEEMFPCMIRRKDVTIEIHDMGEISQILDEIMEIYLHVDEIHSHSNDVWIKDFGSWFMKWVREIIIIFMKYNVYFSPRYKNKWRDYFLE